jgi:hypothetical protein
MDDHVRPMAVCIRSGRGAPLLRRICRLKTASSFELILRQIDNGAHQDQVIVGVYLGESNCQWSSAKMEGIDVGMTLQEAVDVNPMYTHLLFQVKPVQGPEPGSTLALLTRTEGATELPEPYVAQAGDQLDGRQKLYNAIRGYLALSPTARFSLQQDRQMSYFMSTLVGALWLIDGHHDKFAHADHVQAIPAAFFRESPLRALADSTGNAKKRLPPLAAEKIVRHAAALQDLLAAPWFREQRWSMVHADVDGLCTSLSQYVEYLDRASVRMQALHQSTTPARSIANADNFDLTLVPAQSRTATYDGLSLAVNSAGMYNAVNVLVHAPIDPKQRFRYVQALALDVNIELFRYSSGNRTGHVFCWQVPACGSERSMARSVALCTQIGADIPRYHTRAMRAMAVARYAKLDSLNPTVLKHLYQAFTDDATELNLDGVNLLNQAIKDGYDLNDSILMVTAEVRTVICLYM